MPLTTTERANEDGFVHLTYYRKDKQLSFVWRAGFQVIQVCYGGYGEPPMAEIPFDFDSLFEEDPDYRGEDIDALFATFKIKCDRWADTHSPDLIEKALAVRATLKKSQEAGLGLRVDLMEALTNLLDTIEGK
jgi:hypothetical protein